MKRVLSLILVLALVLGCVPTAFAVVPLTDNSAAQEDKIEAVTGIAPEAPAEEEPKENSDLPELTKFESSGWDRFSENGTAKVPEADDVVTFIVVIDEKPQLELYSVSEIAGQTAAVQAHAKQQETALNAVKNRVKSAFGKEEGFKMGFTYTIATTGFSVTTAYGNKAELESMENVSKVYVAPTFTLPENQDFEQYTNNATTMIGANTANETGYTGKGMRVAILDTGIKVDHPSFGALPDSALVDPMTRESVEAIWSELNAGQLTNLLNTSYYNSKLPFVFNYVTGNFDVSNTYAGSDHGTHVAGITAANKLDSTNVVGVAPDAQLVVMQVFQQGGGASWDTIMAALEDCVRLEVDAANLSLGMAAGFVDPEGEMLDTLNLFKDTDIQILTATGNDTNNALMNAWGLNMSLIGNPDIGLAGTPSTYSAALSVGSMDNNGYEMLYITVGGRDLGFNDTAATSYTSFIQNFQAQELEYVVVPGLGTAEDYEGLDVTGKIALVSRGDISFPEKQAIAQEKGAIGLIVYNNASGMFAMQINDGEGNIPAVSISKEAGEYMITEASAEGLGVLTVCDADLKLFKLDISLSDFSSWGVAPDLTLKPEIAGVGGSIYSSVDPAISGSNYGYMSGTSMATPQVAGAMAVLIQYLDENYPTITGAEQRKLAANLMMSTANPILSGNGLEYSPRAQGAGLVDLVKATTSPAYLSVPAASEGRPKVEFRDDPGKTGVYTFSFTITNLSGKAQTYEISSSVNTEQIQSGMFIANAPYGLEAEVVTDGPVTVPAFGTATVNASITLTDADKAYLNQFPNGIWVEGYLYATPVATGEGEQGVTLSMPMVGFYGDWSDADVFDVHVLNDNNYSLYPAVAFTYMSQVGTNPYFRNGKGGDEYNAFSYANPIAEVDFGQLRNAKRLDIKVTDKVTGDVYHTLDGVDIGKTHFNTSMGMIVPTYLMVEYGEIWDGKDTNGKNLPDGTTVTYSFEAWLDDGDDIMDDKWSFDITLDNLAPELLNAEALQSALRLDTDNGRSYLTLELQDNQHIAALIFVSPEGTVMGKYEVSNEPGETVTGEYEITGFGSEFSIIVADYACNETEIEVILDLGDQNNAVPQPTGLSKDRIYGCETFDNAVIEGGWFSVNKADFSDPRNETFDSANRYYAAEYVNGYLVAQNAGTGHLELITPSGSYWSSRVLAQNHGAIGDPNVWVLYDMALDHSGTLAKSYDVAWETNATDALLAVGWMYQGDNDNDGHDDGYNALFNIKFTNYGSVNVQPIARISGVEKGADLLTLGITTDGKVYGIDTAANLYSVATTVEWDESVGEWGDNVIKATRIGTTSFVNYPNYGGANVIQSMGYDHNTGKMYWFAHSQIPDATGYRYENINVTYEVNLETAGCTVVGTYGPAGQTCLFVPNDLQSDLFTMGVEPSGLSIDPSSVYVVEGQTERLKIKWEPWNASPVDVTWSSADETIATVDEYGFVTAQAAGSVEIYATATVNVEPYWDYDENWNWVQFPGGPTEVTTFCLVNVLPSEDAFYGFVGEDYGNPTNNMSWITYSDRNLRDVTNLGQQFITVQDQDGNDVQTEALWYGGTYYNGYVYSTVATQWVENNTVYQGTRLYRSKVTEGATPAETVIGEPELIGVQEGMVISAMAFDYNTGRMYCVENQNIGGLGIIDLETGEVDMLGQPNGDLYGGVYIPGLCVTRDGTIIISDAVASLYTIDPDTLTTKRIHKGEGSPYTAFYEAMFYDYNTDSIYWNMCDGNGESPLYLVMLPQNEWDMATVVDMGDVSTKAGTQQTILFSIPENEPETNVLPVQSIEITNGDAITGLEGGSVKLNTVTVPARPTIQKKTWTSSDENVVTVDEYGNLSYVGVGTATVTVSITNKDEATYGGPYTDSVEVTVLEAAGEFVAFLNADEGGSQYYDYWISGKDYDLRNVAPTYSMIAIYSLRTGVYYDGYFYGYTDGGQFLRIDAENPANYKILGSANLDYSKYQVTGMAVDYTSGTMYGLTLPSNYDLTNWVNYEHPGELVTIDMNTGLLTTVAALDFNTPVFALACDDEGQLYAAGGSFDYYYAASANIYKLDKQSGTLELYTTVNGAKVFTGETYYGTVMYNTQMTYDWGTDRLYLYATSRSYSYNDSCGMFMVQLGEEPTVGYLDGISLWDPSWLMLKYGEVYLGLLAFIPEDDEVPVAEVNGIMVNTTSVRMAVGTTTQITAEVRPSNATDKSVTWVSDDENVATVDENGLITGVAEGETMVTVTSNQTGVSTVIKVTVVDMSGAQSRAYTVSARKDALISFNPNLPGQTAEEVVTLSGGSTIGGMAMGDGCIYYLTNENYSYMLYRFDLTTKQSAVLGQLYLFGEPSGLAYDAQERMFYATSGFYIFMFEEDKLDPNAFNQFSNYMMDSDYCNLTGVAVVEGAIYTFGNDYYSSAPKMVRYSDKYLSDRTVMLEGFPMNFVQGATDIAWDGVTKQFYMTDAGHNIFAMDMQGNVEEIGILGDGIDLNGLAIDYPDVWYMTYTDGVNGTVFADKVVPVEKDAPIPEFIPKRPGYTFTGWTPEVPETATEDMTFTASWSINEYTITFDANGGTLEAEPITITYGETIGELPVPELKNHDFLGWFDENGNEYTAETIYAVDGDLTLTAKWNEHPVIFRSVNTSLGGNIGLNFYVKLAPEIVNDPNAAMRFTFDGRSVVVPMSEAVVSVSNGETRYRFTCRVTSKHMADPVTAQIITSEGAVGEAKTMSVETYCNYIIANSADEETVAMMKAMLNYGAAAQVLFDHNTGSLANAQLSEADKVLADVDASAWKHTITGAEEGIKLDSAVLLLDSETSLRVYFVLTGEKTIDEFTFLVDGKEVKPIQKNERYYLEVRNIAAHNLDLFHQFTVGGLTMEYSVLSYINTVLNFSTDEATINVAKALYAYAQTVEAFVK